PLCGERVQRERWAARALRVLRAWRLWSSDRAPRPDEWIRAQLASRRLRRLLDLAGGSRYVRSEGATPIRWRRRAVARLGRTAVARDAHGDDRPGRSRPSPHCDSRSEIRRRNAATRVCAETAARFLRATASDTQPAAGH